MAVIHSIAIIHSLTVNRWFAQRYNVNNAWIFNRNNGRLNNNNVNNTFRVGTVANLFQYFI